MLVTRTNLASPTFPVTSQHPERGRVCGWGTMRTSWEPTYLCPEWRRSGVQPSSGDLQIGFGFAPPGNFILREPSGSKRHGPRGGIQRHRCERERSTKQRFLGYEGSTTGRVEFRHFGLLRCIPSKDFHQRYQSLRITKILRSTATI